MLLQPQELKVLGRQEIQEILEQMEQTEHQPLHLV